MVGVVVDVEESLDAGHNVLVLELFNESQFEESYILPILTYDAIYGGQHN